MMDEGRGERVEGERLSVKEEGGGGELGSDLDSDPWKILWIRIRKNDKMIVFVHCILIKSIRKVRSTIPL